ncbi:hypothetical protein LCGC14_2574090 [marine sediment metagenome]|uniref:Uncharacterized protein n=1 Tax=marine sediment metagenome TaxID=412755 RepID=A0A0F9AGR2_9ZZZZ
MRVHVAERFADALAMTLYLETASVTGEVMMYVDLADDLRIPINLKTISHFDAGTGGDAAILLGGPGDLLLFLGYCKESDRLHLALIDGAKMKRPPKEIMRHSSFVRLALKQFNEEHVVRGRWTQKARNALWLHAA